MDVIDLRVFRSLAVATFFALAALSAHAQPPSPAISESKPQTANPVGPAEAPPQAKSAPNPSGVPGEKGLDAGDTPSGKPGNTEIEPNGSPGIPDNATTESVTVPKRTILMAAGKSSYDDAFKSIKSSIETVKSAMTKAGLKAIGHPITVFSEPDDKGFKYKVGIPLAAKPDGAFGNGVTIDETPSGKAIKFQHRGAYDDIDSTYDVITAYLDAKGLQVDNPYIEEYLTDLSTSDDPNLQVDIYVFVK